MSRRKAKSSDDSPSEKVQSGLRLLCPETDNGASWTTDRLCTGLVPVDWALSGGFGFGRMSEVFGNYSSGKSYIVYMTLVQVQRLGGVAVLIETEGAFDDNYFRRLGGDPTQLIVIPLDTVEEVFDKIVEVCKKLDDLSADCKVCIAWDSIAATATKHLLEVGMEKKDMTKAGSMSLGCEFICNRIKNTNICMLAVNQVRDKIDKYASGPQTTGGRAYPFYSSQRVELKFDGGAKGSLIEDEGRANEPIGRWLKVFIEKSKLGPAMRTVKLPFYIYDGREHPIFGTPTTIGVDCCEAMLELYAEGAYRLPAEPGKQPWEGEQVVTKPVKGWYQLNPKIAAAPNFRGRDWPKVMEDNPTLWTLPINEP